MLSELLSVVLLAAVSQNALDSGQSALQAGDLVRAEQLFRQYLSGHPQSAEALSNLGAICARRGQFSGAADYYEKALKANPKLVQVHFNLAVALGQLKQYVGRGATSAGFSEVVPESCKRTPTAGTVPDRER